MIRVTSPRAIEFACHSKVCAPPPVGKGGSSKGGSGGGAAKGGSVRGSDLKVGDRIVFAQQVKRVTSVHPMSNGRIGISFNTGGITDVGPKDSFPRASQRVWVPKGNAAKFVKGTNRR